VAEALSARSRHARDLFAPLGPTYDRYAALLSFGQDPRWRRFLVSRIHAGPDSVVLDVATGTAAVAIELVRRTGCRVVGVDPSAEMLATARRRLDRAGLADRVELVEGRAERLPFDDASFDALTFTYLLRYVDDREATMRELARVVKAGARVGMVEFGVPRNTAACALWRLHTRAGLPAVGRVASRQWYEVGRFLGPSIEEFHNAEPDLSGLWRRAGIGQVHMRHMSFGAGLVMWGARDGDSPA